MVSAVEAWERAIDQGWCTNIFVMLEVGCREIPAEHKQGCSTQEGSS
jgi:hypothetical protein